MELKHNSIFQGRSALLKINSNLLTLVRTIKLTFLIPDFIHFFWNQSSFYGNLKYCMKHFQMLFPQSNLPIKREWCPNCTDTADPATCQKNEFKREFMLDFDHICISKKLYSLLKKYSKKSFHSITFFWFLQR